jgi:hypothetical protein
MADVLMNSPLNLPVSLSLRHSLADKAHLTPVNTPTNAVYVSLPSFVTVTGTLGNAKSEINKAMAGGLLIQSLGSVPQLGDKAGAILQGVGNLLTKQPNPASTNAPAKTNATAAEMLAEGLNGLLSRQKAGSKATNAPAALTSKTNTPSQDANKVPPPKK